MSWTWMLVEIGENDGDTLLCQLLESSGKLTLAYFVRSMVGLDRTAAQELFSDYLSDRSLRPAQIRFIEMVIDQLTSRGVMETGALYEAPFTDLHSAGPDELFSGRDNVINGIFDRLNDVKSVVIANAR